MERCGAWLEGTFNKVDHAYFYISENAAQAKDWFKGQHYKHAAILVKGSRSTQMEKVLE